MTDPHTHRAFALLTADDIEQVLTALALGDEAEAGHVLNAALNRISATPAPPRASSTPPVESRDAGKDLNYLALVRELAGFTA